VEPGEDIVTSDLISARLERELHDNDPAVAELGALLSELGDNALRLLAGTARPPSALRLRAGAVSLDIEWAPVVAAASADPVAESEPVVSAPPVAPRHLTAPMVGVFYRAPEPGAPPFVGEGDVVAVGQQIGIIEAMKLMIPVEADRAGRIVEVCVDDSTAVEFGEPLFALAPDGE
jgi:acetyl-CoA carboxylase biotin carboxyl carrier protein